ncbi:lycopene cyclase domain-containing protein [Salinigranum rubrum]|uniref:Lycopene cyclase domain-containing protein n=1 Tax=Salinigranum rubrum TaxID=755307 RepID=A0A2I8VP49_9EURY|nr:lycopene cyclase domain-containing protein [Salinigranum rubrum]AUV83686.1 lycopene cyclase domain-containing protein [Salinigranum rubrum]
MRLTYLGFHLVFILPPLLLLLRAAPSLPSGRRRVALTGLVGITLLALVYTTPWDNFLIDQGVWWYGEGTVVAYIGSAPLEEYLFFVLQPVLSGLFLYTMGFSPAFEPSDTRLPPRLAGGVGFLALSALGGVLLTTTSGYYLGAILVWACPLLALQWAVGGGYLVRRRHEWPVAVAVPTLYLWFADRVAIGLGVWTISDTQTLGIDILGLPFEEAAFFLVTNLLVVQGLVLFEWVMHRWGRLTLDDEGDTETLDRDPVDEAERDPAPTRVSPQEPTRQDASPDRSR